MLKISVSSWLWTFVLLFITNAYSFDSSQNFNGINDFQCCCHPQIPKGHWYIDAGAGWVYNFQTDKFTVEQQGFFPDLYVGDKNNDSEMFAIAAGYSWANDEGLPFVSLGLEYSNYTPVKATGQINKFFSPKLASYIYQYKIRSQQVNLLAKVDFYYWKGFSPFIQLGIGNSWTTVGSYQEKAQPGVTPRIPPGFNTGRTNNVVYVIGAGLDYLINKNFQIGVSYRYDDMGKAHSGNGVSTFANVNLNGRTRFSVLMLDLRYLFA